MARRTLLLSTLVLLFCGSLIAFASADNGGKPWDFLRPLSDFAVQFDALTKLLVFVLSVALLLIALLAYRKKKSKRLLLVAAAFTLFGIKWGLKVADLFVSPGWFLPDSSENVFELLILLSLFLALFYRR